MLGNKGSKGAKQDKQHTNDREYGELRNVIRIHTISMLGVSICVGIYWWVVHKESFLGSVRVAMLMVIISYAVSKWVAVPLPFKAGIHKSDALGVQYKDKESLERLGRTDVVVFGKTGTLTNGHPELTDFDVYNYQIEQSGVIKVTEEENRLLYEETKIEIMADVASLESMYDNPISRAIVKGYKDRYNTELIAPSVYETVVGKGITGVTRNKRYYIGNREYIKSLDVEIPYTDENRLTSQGKTVLYVVRGRKFVGMIAVADKVRVGAKETIHELDKLGCECVLVTGDTQQNGKYVAQEVGIDDVKSGLSPEGKASVIRKLQEKGLAVLMVGYGYNEVPALKQADCGMVMGKGIGDLTYVEDSRVTTGEISAIVKAILISKRVKRVVKQNLLLTFTINSMGIPIALGMAYSDNGGIPLLTVALGGILTSILAVGVSTLRLKRATR